MKDKNKDLWLIFLSTGVMFFIISTTISITWLKYTLLIISMIQFVISIIFALKKFKK